VHILIRSDSLAASMSDYLISRIEAAPNRITLHRRTEITALQGDRHLERVTWTDGRTGADHTRRVANVILMLGAVPNTDWLDGAVALDEKGFILTGATVDDGDARLMETSRPGVFAVGDVRAGSVKRVASGVGEGAIVVSAVHQALSDLRVAP
jgi:thioredoxin reductase (NADPH)